ncbi:MAG TPA: L,D-transpeptidase family protein [Clostridiaceae bacterium]
MSKFTKIVIVLLSLLFIEMIIIYFSFSHNVFASPNYNDKSPILLMVDVSSNILSVFQDGKVIKTYNIGGGKTSTPSPIGNWQIINKGTWTGGFGGRWMGLNVPWGTYGIHGTLRPNSIGWNSSHGCIRMNNKDVSELYDMVKIGTMVMIWGGPNGNFGNNFRRIKPGDIGSDVYEVQIILKEKGYINGAADGIYSEDMRNIIHKYENDNMLPINDIIDLKFYKELGVYLID